MKKFITNFDTTAELATVSATPNFGRPHVSLTEDDRKVHYFGDPYNRLEFVDLGLSSGLKWATCNVGAKRPEDCGLLFAWGETTGYNIDDNHDFTQDNYNGPSDELILPNINNDYIIPAGCDAATVNMRDKWRTPRIPTKADFEELIANCNVDYTYNYGEIIDEDTYDTIFEGYEGNIFTSKNNGNSIFIPVDTEHSIYEYWTSSGFNDGYDDIINITIYEYNNSLSEIDQNIEKHYGHFIRPVCE